SNGNYGVIIQGNSNLIAGNSIGTDAMGTVARPNFSIGVRLLTGHNNTIGGTTAGAGNLISGHSNAGIAITDTGNFVQGNRIGTDATGNASLGNNEGVVVQAANNTIGGTAPGAGNLISGNTFDGVNLSTGATGSVVAGNLIGTNAAGTAALANGRYGVLVQ